MFKAPDTQTAIQHVWGHMSPDRSRADAGIVLQRMIDDGRVKWVRNKWQIADGLDFDAEYVAWRNGK